MVCRFAMQGMESLSGINSIATRNLLDMWAQANRCSVAVVCQSVEKSDHDNGMVAHDEYYKNSRIVLSSPDPLRETPKRILNSPQAGSFNRAGLVKRIQ
jgi:hypothetical protein